MFSDFIIEISLVFKDIKNRGHFFGSKQTTGLSQLDGCNVNKVENVVICGLEIKQNDLALGCQAVFFANILDHDDDDEGDIQIHQNLA